MLRDIGDSVLDLIGLDGRAFAQGVKKGFLGSRLRYRPKAYIAACFFVHSVSLSHLSSFHNNRSQ